MKSRGLGKGFGSLLPANFDESLILDKKDRVQKLLITDIIPHPDQPRKTFGQKELGELATSVKRFGILQPIVVMSHDDGYVIVAGERRFRAAQMAGLTHVPALIRTLEELERLEIALVENVQRVDLSPLEQARAVARLTEEFNLTLQDIAQRLGKAQTTIINSVRLLQLPKFVQKALEDREISEGHARSILALNNEPEKQKELLDSIRSQQWSVRQAERFVQSARGKKSVGQKSNKPSHLSSSQAKQLESLQDKLGRHVKVKIQTGFVNLSVPFDSPQDLETVLEKLAD